jgi:RHS repeat-associated protein
MLMSGRLHVLLELPDHLGSTSIVVDKETSELVEASAYLAYGGADSDYRPDRWKSFREDYRFTGKEEDVEVGLRYFGGRYFAAELGRWVSADPLAVHQLGADPNAYAYVRGRAFRAVDPLGLSDVDGKGPEVGESGVAAEGSGTPCPTPAGPSPEAIRWAADKTQQQAQAELQAAQDEAAKQQAEATRLRIRHDSQWATDTGAPNGFGVPNDAHEMLHRATFFGGGLPGDSTGERFAHFWYWGPGPAFAAMGGGFAAGNLTGPQVNFSARSNARSANAAGGTTNPSTALVRYYPPNNGFLGKPTSVVLKAGTVIDRYGGSAASRFFSPAGTPLAARALPPDTAAMPLRSFEVLKPITAEAGRAAPAFGGGLGTQFRTSLALEELIQGGSLREITP